VGKWSISSFQGRLFSIRQKRSAFVGQLAILETGSVDLTWTSPCGAGPTSRSPWTVAERRCVSDARSTSLRRLRRRRAGCPLISACRMCSQGRAVPRRTPRGARTGHSGGALLPDAPQNAHTKKSFFGPTKNFGCSINKTFGCCSKIFGCSNKKFICCP